MNICNLTEDRFDGYFKFLDRAYPNRNLKELFKNEILKKANVIISVNKNSQIVGHLTCYPCEFYLNNVITSGNFYCNFLVLQEHRNKGIGSSLVKKATTEHKPWFAFGVNNFSKSLAYKIGKIIGSSQKFVWFRNSYIPIKIFTNPLRKYSIISDTKELTDSIYTGRNYFTNLKSINNWQDYFWGNNTLQFSRPYKFLERKIFSKINKHTFYYFENSSPQVYFTVKKSYIRGLNVLEIVDYKVPNHTSELFIAIINAAKYLTKKLKFDGVIFESSHQYFDRILSFNNFIKIGKPRLIISNIETNISQEKIKNRDFLYITPIDSP
ncbi:MAG: GNAT family N-acetyltransferase [Candidatus Melainabacteria bacterium]|nr:GNAT family N-acetyltransferase [Candidatus Melainabacteria bacterium]